MTNARMAAREKRRASSMEMTMDVRISAAPSLVNSAEQHAEGKQAPAVVPAERRPNPSYGVPVEGGARKACSSALAASAIDCSS